MPEVAPTVHRGGLWEFSGVRTTGADIAEAEALPHSTDGSGVKPSHSHRASPASACRPQIRSVGLNQD